MTDADEEWLLAHRDLYRYAVSVLGEHGWFLLRSYGRLMNGPSSGRYVSALSFEAATELVNTLARGDEIDVHLMHRHVSGNYESSTLRLEGGQLVMRFPDREERA